MRSLLHQIRQQVFLRPQAVAYRCAEETLTYLALWEQAGKVAALLTEEPADTPIAIFGHKGSLMPVCILGCMRAGRPYLPIDASCPPARVLRILQNAGVSRVLAVEPLTLADAAGAIGVDLVTEYTCPLGADRKREVCQAYPSVTSREDLLYADSKWEEQSPLEWLDSQLSCEQLEENSLLYILYTSGSTGVPKGVRIPLGNAARFTAWAGTLAQGAVWLNQAPYAFDLSVMALFPALVSGAALFDVDQTGELGQLFDSLKGSNTEVWVSTPSFAELCLADPAFHQALLPRLHTFLFCGETLHPHTVQRLFARFGDARVINTYGPTESTVAVTAAEITPDCVQKAERLKQPLPVGRAKPGSGLLIVDSELRPLPDGEQGQIVITGDTVAYGYVGEVQPEKFPVLDGVPAYLTGDAGLLLDGELHFRGRIDSQIKLHGYRIEPAEIEAVLLSIPEIRWAAILPKLDDGQVRWLTAFVCGGNHTTLELRRFLRGQLPGYMVPRRIVRMDMPPLNSNGKCDFNKLKGLV